MLSLRLIKFVNGGIVLGGCTFCWIEGCTSTNPVGPGVDAALQDTAVIDPPEKGDAFDTNAFCTGIHVPNPTEGVPAYVPYTRGSHCSEAQVGAAYNRIDAAERKGSDSLVTLKTALSEVEDTDLPKAMVDLQMHEVAYQAALASTARVMQPSLVDFLR